MEMKYIQHSTVGFILWPRVDTLYHSDVAEAVLRKAKGTIISAGFVFIDDGRAWCHGRSESLNIDCAKGDSEKLRQQLFGPGPSS